MNLSIVTDRLIPGEWCAGYFCGPKWINGFSEQENPRMVEMVFVVRGDTIAKYMQDFGPASRFPGVPMLVMPTAEGDGSTVEEMQAWGEKHRAEPDGKNHIARLREESTFWEDAITQEEKIHEIIRNKSIIGPHVSIQRNGFDFTNNQRRARDQRARITRKVQL